MVKLLESIGDMVYTLVFALWVVILTMFSFGKSCLARIIIHTIQQLLFLRERCLFQSNIISSEKVVGDRSHNTCSLHSLADSTSRSWESQPSHTLLVVEVVDSTAARQV